MTAGRTGLPVNVALAARGLAGEYVGKGRGDCGHARRQQPVGAPDDRVGVVNERRDAAKDRRQYRRNRRIAAKTNHRRGLEPADQREGLREA